MKRDALGTCVAEIYIVILSPWILIVYTILTSTLRCFGWRQIIVSTQCIDSFIPSWIRFGCWKSIFVRSARMARLSIIDSSALSSITYIIAYLSYHDNRKITDIPSGIRLPNRLPNTAISYGCISRIISYNVSTTREDICSHHKSWTIIRSQQKKKGSVEFMDI